jgi:hypothetical protein
MDTIALMAGIEKVALPDTYVFGMENLDLWLQPRSSGRASDIGYSNRLSSYRCVVGALNTIKMVA